jgi:hypothetical protein
MQRSLWRSRDLTSRELAEPKLSVVEVKIRHGRRASTLQIRRGLHHRYVKTLTLGVLSLAIL